MTTYGTDKVHVSAYERDDGTDIREYWRAYPNSCQTSNKNNITYNNFFGLTHKETTPKMMNVEEKILHSIISSAILLPTARTNYLNAINNFKKSSE